MLDISKVFLIEERRVRECARSYPIFSESLHNIRRSEAVSCPVTVPISLGESCHETKEQFTDTEELRTLIPPAHVRDPRPQQLGGAFLERRHPLPPVEARLAQVVQHRLALKVVDAEDRVSYHTIDQSRSSISAICNNQRRAEG